MSTKRLTTPSPRPPPPRIDVRKSQRRSRSWAIARYASRTLPPATAAARSVPRSRTSRRIAIAIAILLLVRERGTDRAAAVAGGSVRDAYRAIAHDRDLRWLFLTSILGGGGRGLGVVNLFVLIYLTKVIGLGESLSGLMYGALIVFSVPMPLIAGWLSDRIGRKPLIIGVYVGGAIGFVVFLI